jgi:hypothetical protein
MIAIEERKAMTITITTERHGSMTLTTEHAASSYQQLVAVKDGQAFGPADVWQETVFGVETAARFAADMFGISGLSRGQLPMDQFEALRRFCGEHMPTAWAANV